MTRDDVRYAVAAREHGLRRVRKLTLAIGSAGAASCAVLFGAFGHAAAQSVQASHRGQGTSARASSSPARASHRSASPGSAPRSSASPGSAPHSSASPSAGSGGTAPQGSAGSGSTSAGQSAPQPPAQPPAPAPAPAPVNSSSGGS